MSGTASDFLSDYPDTQDWPESLERYIFCYYTHLLTPSERAGWGYILRCGKRDAAEDQRKVAWEPRIEKAQSIAFEDPAIKTLLEKYPNKFFESVTRRVLRDDSDKVYLNLCRNCLNLCMTPRARLCLRCGFSWHDEEPYEYERHEPKRWWAWISIRLVYLEWYEQLGIDDINM